MPMIKRNIEQKYSSKYSNGRRTDDWLVISDPDMAIAKGAAKYAGVLSGLIKGQITIEDKTTHSYGFKCYEDYDKSDKFIVLNKIMSTDEIVIPHREFSLLTVIDNQTATSTTIIENDKTVEEFDYNGEPALIEHTLSHPHTPKALKLNLF